MTLRNKLRQHLLHDARRLSVIDGARPGESLHQRGRHHDKAEPEAPAERLGESAYVQNAGVVGHAAQRRNTLRAVLEFAVVIVFNDPGTIGLGPGNECSASHQTHLHTKRKLVRRRDYGQPGTRIKCCALAYAQTFVVNRHRPHQRTLSNQVGANAQVTRVFHHDFIAIVEQEPRNQIQRLLRASRNDHLRRCAADAARYQQPLRNRRPERWLTSGFGIAGTGNPGSLGKLPFQSLPERERELFQRRTADPKWQSGPARWTPAQSRLGNQAAALREQLMGSHSGCAMTTRRWSIARGNIGAVTDPRYQIAFRLQTFQRPQYGVA